MLALLTGISGWEADAALTWFAAFASLMLMMGLAAWIAGRAAAALWVLPLAARRFAAGVACAVGPIRVAARRASSAGERLRRLARPGELGAAASDLGVVRRAGDLADEPTRAARHAVAGRDDRPGRRRRLRELDLGRWRHVRWRRRWPWPRCCSSTAEPRPAAAASPRASRWRPCSRPAWRRRSCSIR